MLPCVGAVDEAKKGVKKENRMRMAMNSERVSVYVCVYWWGVLGWGIVLSHSEGKAQTADTGGSSFISPFL